MIELLSSPEAHLNALNQIFKEKINRVDFSTFGLWATSYGNSGSLEPFFDKLNQSKINHRLLLGVSKFSSRSKTEDPCSFCATHYRNQIQRLLDYKKKWRDINWSYHPENHTKLVMAYNVKGLAWIIMGGHNLTFSSFKDSSIKIPAAVMDQTLIQELTRQFNSIWLEAHPDLSDIKTQFELEVITAKPPCVEKKQPTEEELIEFLQALAKEKFLSKERFTKLAKSCSAFIDQKKGELKGIQVSDKLSSALKLYKNSLTVKNTW